jgi:hypothetical protein
MKYKLLFISIIAFIFSWSPYLIARNSRTNLILILGGGLLYLSVIALSEFVTRKWGDFSLLKGIMRRKKSILIYVGIATLGGIILDGTAQWLNRLWYYPYWTNPFYVFIFIAGFSAYFLCIIERYLMTKVVIDKLRKGRHYKTKPYKREGRFFGGLLVLAFITFAIGLTGSLIPHFVNQGEYNFNITYPTQHVSMFIFPLLIFAGVWFFSEYMSFIKKRSSLLQGIIHKNFNSLFAVLLASLLLLIIMEIQNASLGLWVYANWPLSHIRLFTIPLIAVLAWPLHYIAILSVYRALNKRQTEEIFRGDVIE